MYMRNTVPRRAKRMSSLSVEGQTDILSHTDELPFKKFLIFLVFIGALPFTRRAPYYPSLHPTKSTLAIAVTVYTFILASSYYMLTFYVHRLMSEDFSIFEKFLYAHIVVISISVFITVAVWSDTPAIRRGILIWFRISRLYFKITNRVLIPRWRNSETVIVVIVSFFPSLIFHLTKKAFPELKVSYFFAPACLQPLTVFFLVCALWIGYFSYLKGVAEEINKDLSSNIKRRILETDKLTCYQEIWLQMRALTDSLSSLSSPVVVFVFAVESSILYIYMFITYIQMGKYFGAIPCLLLSTTLIGAITLMVNASHVAIEQVKRLHSSILAGHKYDLKEVACDRQVLYMYLVEKARNPTPTLGNFIVVNKALLTSILGTIATHLVVLAQVTQPKRGQGHTHLSVQH